jgi:D-alanyl-D-alanine carboxypeptidase
MFRAIASLLLYGALSPVALIPQGSSLSPLIQVTSPSPSSPLTLPGTLHASGAIVVDVETGRELFEQAADHPRPIGSLAKLLTAIIVVEQHNLDEIVTVPAGTEVIDGAVVDLYPGERFRVRDLLAALLIASANDAAYTLALHHSGSMEAFAEAMNARARSLGLQQSHFENPMGFDSAGQYSTPRELSWLARSALQHEVLRTLAAERQYIIWEISGKRMVELRTTNQLLLSHPSFFFGLKTGTTDQAGECLISLAITGGRSYLLVILKSSDRYRDTLQLFHSLSQARA